MGFMVLSVVAAGEGMAQVASFDIPDEIVIERGKLSVAFLDGVSETDAAQWLRDEGYEPDKISFNEVVVRVQSSEPFSAEGVRRLRDHVAVVDVESTTAPRFGSDGLGVPALFVLNVRLIAPTAQDEARKLIEDIIGLTPFEVVKRPNDIEVRVPEGEEELALEALQENPWVAYVTYVAVAGDGR